MGRILDALDAAIGKVETLNQGLDAIEVPKVGDQGGGGGGGSDPTPSIPAPVTPNRMVFNVYPTDRSRDIGDKGRIPPIVGKPEQAKKIIDTQNEILTQLRNIARGGSLPGGVGLRQRGGGGS